MRLADNIYCIMERKKMKQSSVAIAAGYKVKTFNAMLRGRKQILEKDIIPICKALEVTPNELYGFLNNDNVAG